VLQKVENCYKVNLNNCYGVIARVNFAYRCCHKMLKAAFIATECMRQV